MPKTVTSTHAKVNLGSIMDWAVENQDEVVVESRGKPRVVIVAYDEYEQLLQLREQSRRKDALKRMEQLARKVQKRNADLTQDEAETLADKVTREAIDSLVAKGKVKFQED